MHLDAGSASLQPCLHHQQQHRNHPAVAMAPTPTHHRTAASFTTPTPRPHLPGNTPHSKAEGPPEPSGSSENERWKRAQGQWGRGLSGAVMTQGGGAGREEGAGVL